MSRHFLGFDTPPLDQPDPGDLTAADRRDGCHAQALHRAEVCGTELLFCNHCWRRHKDRLPQTEPAAASGAAGE